MHTCPECGQACTCTGDIEDHDTGDEFYEECYHCDGAEYPDDDDGFEPGRIEAQSAARLTAEDIAGLRNVLSQALSATAPVAREDGDASNG